MPTGPVDTVGGHERGARVELHGELDADRGRRPRVGHLDRVGDVFPGHDRVGSVAHRDGQVRVEHPEEHWPGGDGGGGGSSDERAARQRDEREEEDRSEERARGAAGNADATGRDLRAGVPDPGHWAFSPFHPVGSRSCFDDRTTAPRYGPGAGSFKGPSGGVPYLVERSLP